MWHFGAGEHFTQFRSPLLGIVITMRLPPESLLIMTAFARGSSTTSRTPFMMWEVAPRLEPRSRHTPDRPARPSL